MGTIVRVQRRKVVAPWSGHLDLDLCRADLTTLGLRYTTHRQCSISTDLCADGVMLFGHRGILMLHRNRSKRLISLAVNARTTPDSSRNIRYQPTTLRTGLLPGPNTSDVRKKAQKCNINREIPVQSEDIMHQQKNSEKLI